MSRTFYPFALFIASLLFAGSALAGPPDHVTIEHGAWNCSSSPCTWVPCSKADDAGLFVDIGGRSAFNPAVADFMCEFCVTVLDAGGGICSTVPIEFSFLDCTDLRLCTEQVIGAVVLCGAGQKSVMSTTNTSGSATFRILGAGTNPGTVMPPDVYPGPGRDCVEILSGATHLGSATAVIFDQDGTLPPQGVGPSFRNGVKGSDLPVVLNDLYAGYSSYRGRTDYDHDGSVAGSDLSMYLVILGNSNSGTGSSNGCATSLGDVAPYCP